jgi:hypothetical protein
VTDNKPNLFKVSLNISLASWVLFSKLLFSFSSISAFSILILNLCKGVLSAEVMRPSIINAIPMNTLITATVKNVLRTTHSPIFGSINLLINSLTRIKRTT